MLRYQNYNIVFQEIPDEVTLAINLANCPNHCVGCHSPYLWDDLGDVLNEESLAALLKKYGGAITCVCFMGGDAEPKEVERLAEHLHRTTAGRLKFGWYSGKAKLPEGHSLHYFNYVKLGPYVERLGGLDSPTTNQRLYRVDDGLLTDITHRFRENKKAVV